MNDLQKQDLRPDVSSPEGPVAAEKRSRWNETATDYPRHATVPELFAAQAARRPQAVALCYGTETVSYGELERRSYLLARRLQRTGVSLESPVGVFLEPSCGMVVALLAILRAGGTYVPLDPSYPASRLAFMLEDTSPAAVISQASLIDRLPSAVGEVVDVEEALEEEVCGGEDPGQILCPQQVAENLAYIIYTSGSTGQPKGVGIPHRGLVRLLLRTNYIDLGPEDRVAQAANLSFDVAGLEIWGPLLHGGCVVGLSQATILEPSLLALELRRRRIGHLLFPSALFNQTVRQCPEAFRELAFLMVGVEAVDAGWMRHVLEHGAPGRLSNGYGPTENSVCTAVFPIAEIAPEATTIPIGFTVSNSTTYVVDHRLRRLAVGSSGELVTGGDGLARGYQRRPRLTAQCFVPDPFGKEAGGRLYRTGDLARRRADGALLFEGRVDHQVKLRGFRIELGEIETALAAHPQVAASAVMLHAGAAACGIEDQELVAWVVPRKQEVAVDPEVQDQAGDPQVAQWQVIFEDLYGAGEHPVEAEDPTFDTTGWVSTYTEEPIPAPEMREWLADTIDRITSLAPRRVLEIGCGTGMLLFRIAPTTEHYFATDISPRVVAAVEAALAARGDLAQVRLAVRSADQLDDLEAGFFDTVLLNSVVQYFPSAQYLAMVLRRAARLVRPGGAIFVGDVRNLALLDTFHTAVELFQAAEDLSVEALRRNIDRRRRRENELVLDPAFFSALQEQVPEIGGVEIVPKRGRAQNELTAYRYQVVLHIGPVEHPTASLPWLDWRGQGLSLAALRQRLVEGTPPWLGLRGVPNRRLVREVAAQRLVAEANALVTVGEVRREVLAAEPEAVDAQDLWDLGEDLAYDVAVGQSNDEEGSLTVVLRQQSSPREGLHPVWTHGALQAVEPSGRPPSDDDAGRDSSAEGLERWANQPTQEHVERPRINELRTFLAGKLPPHMVPAAFGFLDALPLTANGKIDRAALKLLASTEAFESTSEAAMPRTPMQDLVATLWAQVLDLDRVGIDEDFFALGGHSLKATQVVSRLRETLDVGITVRQVMDAATVARLTDTIEDLLRRQEGRGELPPLTACSDQDRAVQDRAVPALFAQRRLWFLHHWLPGNPAYNVPLVLHFRGPLMVAALDGALTEIARRHEALRTTFQEGETGPVQLLAPAARVPLPWVDLSALGAGGGSLAEKLCAAVGLRPYNLATGPLWRPLLVRLSRQEHLLLAGFHHLIFDGWSMGIFYRELAALYDAALVGLPSPLPRPAIQPADYALWQHSWLEGEMLASELAWWRQRLHGAPTVLDLPTDRPRPALEEMKFSGRSARFALPPALGLALEEVGRRRGATLFMVLLAAFQALLSRLTGQGDFLVGAPVANRTRREIEDLIGFFVNTLALRAQLAEAPSFAILLDRARQETLAAYAHQDLPFDTLVQALEPERRLGIAPLVQVMMVFQTAPMEVVQPSGLQLDVRLLPTGASRADLGLEWTLGPGGLNREVEYNAELLDATTVERWMGCFTVLLEAVAQDPDLALADLSLLSAVERHQLLAEWNDTATTGHAAPWSPVHGLIARQAGLRPEAVALEQGLLQLSFGELRRRVTGLAALLSARGLRAEARVGLSIHRSPELLISMLAVLEAGGAYVPLDPDHPQERRATLLRESRASFLLSAEGSEAEGTKTWAGIPHLDLLAEHTATLLEQMASASGVVRSAVTASEGLAYVLYTSGSSGRPKGVMVSHGALANFLGWMLGTFDFEPGDSYLARTPPVFDPSIKEFFLPLMSGGRVVLVEGRGQADSPYLAKVAAERRIRYLQLVPFLLQLFLEEPGLGSIPLKRLFCGGEVLPTKTADRWAESALGNLELVNFYGPTETCVLVTWARFPGGAHVDPWSGLTIGRPIGNTQIYVLATDLSPTPRGVLGECMIAGRNLARGYLGAPRQTAEVFLPDPFAAQPGARLYRTGDLVHHLQDGRSIFARRRDVQIKLRGLRIEPAEIESALLAHPAARSAVVTCQEGVLVAWLIAAAAETPSSTALREFLARSLPAHLLPTHFRWVDSMPTAVSGKIDRAALGRRALPTVEVPGADDAPRTAVEEILQGIAIEVLGREDLGRSQSFFDLGGHSLLATRWVSRIRAALGVDIPLTTLFKSSTIAALAQQVEAAQQRGVGLETPPLGRREEALEPAPASFAQERLWFLYQWQPESPVYNVPVVLRLVGRLDVRALESSLAEIDRRHEVLRTVLEERGEGPPVQRIMPHRGPALARVDLSSLRCPEVASQRLLRWAAGRPFDLARGPLWWAFLMRSKATEHRLFLGFHHMVFDGASMAVFTQELTELYEAFCQGMPSPLPELAVRYGDFSVWQRGWLRGPRLAAEIKYWRHRLAGAPALLELPTDRPRPAVVEDWGANLQLTWAASLAPRLEQLARTRGATLFMVLVAGFTTLMARLSGRRDVVVGMPIANRGHRALEPLLGLFVNTLALRLDLTGRPTFDQLLVQVREVALDAYRHQDLPFEKLIGELRPDRNLSHTPFVQAMVGLVPGAAESIQLGAVQADVEFIERSTAKLDLSLILAKVGDRLRGEVEFRTQLFEVTTVARWLEHLATLLAAATADPSREVEALPWLQPAQSAQLVVQWNDTGLRQAPWVAVHRLFAHQSYLRPEAVALEQGEVQLSFAALGERVVELATRLVARGLRPEMVVGLAMPRSPELVIAILGVLEAGGAYLPLDPDHPEERSATLLRDSRAAWLLTAGGTEAVAGISCRDLLALDPAPAGEAVSLPLPTTSPEQLAYVVYTSGSTGKPKGVMISHRCLANLMVGMRDVFAFGPEDSFLQRTPFVFDASVWEFFAPLATGGRLVLVEGGGQADPAALAEATVERRINHLQMVPALARLFLAQPGLGNLPLKRLICGGEAMPPELAERLWGSARGRVELFNFYGPTEACAQVTWGRIPLGVPQDPWNSLAIGRPIPNTEAYVLDARFRLAPLGVLGELMIAGENLARGYLGAPRQTAEAFLPSPFAPAPGGRLYRTGDLVQTLADGRLLFHRRKDFQIKLRGVRIEPAEIETTLVEHPAVRSAVVTLQEQQLVAWLMPAHGEPPTALELREFLARSLPIHMVPTLFLWLDSLPTAATGKVDRAALQSRALPAVEEDHVSDAPRTPSEEILQHLWSQVLKRGVVGRSQNFFDLGGHSLVATQVTSRASTLFGIRLGPRQLFEHPTVAAFAAEVDRQRAGGLKSSDVAEPMPRVSRRQPLVLSFGQERLWFLDQLSPGNLTYNSTAPLGLEGHLEVEVLRSAFEQLVHRHEILRTTFGRVGDQPVQRIAAVGRHPLPLVDLQGLAESLRRRLVERLTFEEEQRPYDLAQGPLFRTLLLRLADDQHALLMSCHHIVFDGWSLGILMDEVIALYGQGVGAAEERNDLQPIAVQYADYAAWQRRKLEGEALQEQLAWWRQALACAGPSARLPVDVPRAQAGPSRARRQGFRISAHATQGLRDLARQENATLFMTLLAAFKTLLHRLTGADAVTVGTPIANRHHLESEGLIGFFVNTLVIQTDFAGAPSFRSALTKVRDAALGAYDHQDLPYEKLVADLASGRPGGAQPLFQSLFTLGDPPPQPRQVPGLLFRPLPPAPQGRRGAAFDLSLGIVDPGPSDGFLAGSWEYDGALFEAATIDTLVRRFNNLLEQIVRHPDRAVADLEFLSPTEEQQLHAAAALAHEAETEAGTMTADSGDEAVEQRSEEDLRAKVSARKKGLSEAKRALLARRLKRRKKTATPRLDAIPRRPETGPAPLSFAQERLWFLDQLDPGSPTYNMTLPLRLKRSLDLAALADSFAELWRRHEGTRTRFVVQDGVPKQVADAPHQALAMRRGLPVVDLSGLPQTLRDSEVDDLLQDECGHRFDLERGPLVRVTLLRLSAGGDEHVLFFNIHHIISDGWSSSILTSELAALYGAWAGTGRGAGGHAGSGGRPQVLAPPTLQYSDFAHWQRQWLAGQELDRQLAYWRRQLAGELPVLDLPGDRPRPALQTFRGASYRQPLSLEISTGLRQLGRRAESTLFVTLLSALTVLLGRLGGHEEVLVGTPIAGRSRSELEGLVGMFLNTLVLRADLRGAPSFEGLLARLHEVSLGAFAHQDLPFERLLEELAPARDLSRTPLFQVFFNLINLGSIKSPALGEATTTQTQAALEIEELSPQDLFDVASKFDLTLYVDDRPEIAIDWVYNADLFDPARIVEMAAQYEVLLTAMVTAPETSIAAVSLVTPSAAPRLPDPGTPLNDHFEGSIPQLFGARVAEAPHRIAVVDAKIHLSYASLAETSASLAQHLQAQGVAPGQVVAIYGYREAALVEAILAILESSAAFLILDPANPAQRQIACLEQLGGRLGGWVHLQAAGALPVELLAFLEGNAKARGEGSTSPGTPQAEVGADSLAYVAFTSGSTGTPKGILGRHGSLTHFIPWQRQAFGLGPEDRYSLVSGLAHDPLHREVFTPLQTGATVVLPAAEDLDLVGHAAQFMERQRITVAHLTPAMGQLLAIRAAEAPMPRLEALRWAFYVGDLLTHYDVDRLRGMAPQVKVVNYFGSTETQRAVAYHVVEEGEAGRGVVPVGRGMPDVQLLLLTPQHHLAGVGEVAEICVRSPHLALGYLEDGDLTRQRFVPVPPRRHPADRMYRTGDLGRYRLDGGVEVVGRADRQVKIRGVRVELGEIEAALGGHPAVREAVVVQRREEGRPGDLVAYVTGPPLPLGALARELREHLRQRLPEAMVPAFYVGLEALPLTANRKVDRAALPAPERGEGQSHVAPSTAVEEVLVELWREVLGLEQPVSVLASFFELGGHSLLAAQLMARVRQAFQVDIPLRRLFQSPTARGLAQVVGQSRSGGPPVELAPITPDEEKRYQPFPMTEVQEAYWIGRTGEFELGNVATHSYLELELPNLDLARFEAAWQRLIERHDMLRAVMLPDGRQQVLETVPPYRIKTLDLRGRPPAEAAAAVARTRDELSHQVLDPGIWPLFDLRASRLDGGQVRLHISRDLLIYDAWSASLLMEELMATYRVPDLALEPLEITFRDYVMAEEGERQGAAYELSVDYWQKRLDSLPAAPELPLAVDPAKLEHPRFERRTGGLPAASWRLVRQRASRAGLTPSAVLLAAYAEVLAAFSKSPGFTLNLTLFNRQPRHPQVHQLVGDFTSLTLLEVAGRPGQSFADRARQIQQQLWDDLDHRGVGGVWVQRQLARRRGGGSGALMPVVFTSTLGLQQVAGTSTGSTSTGSTSTGTSKTSTPADTTAAAPQNPQEGQGRLVFNITQTPQVWLDHQISEQDDQLSYIWDAVADLFPDGLLDAMFQAYEAFLADLALEETWAATNRRFLPPQQLAVRREINATAAPQPAGLLHGPLLHQLRTRPDDLAVVAAGQRLTYGELDLLSLRLAHRLQGLGARPNQLVAVVMEKGWEQVVAVVAVLRAGAAYQPIEATLPEERRRHLLARGEVEIVLTEGHRVDGTVWPAGLEVLAVTADLLPAGPTAEPAIETQATDLAYVIFTSGSTGEPKGVMIDHRGALNTIADIGARFAIGAEDRVLALSALGFDLSVWDLFGVLGAGGTVVLPEPAARRDPSRWLELITTHGVTLWNTVPALMEMYVEYVSGRDGRLGPLRLVMMSGDWIPVTLPNRIRRLGEAAIEIVSLGGATEASIWSILYPIGEVDPAAASIPYGRPMVNQSFHVLDGALEPRPVWVPGELYIGGIGLAKGYWRDARKTALSFVPYPGAESPGERLYLTGDLGRYLPAGEIEFLGREDFQVKVRGHRIELGEIEATLARHATVREAVALALGEATGSRRLAAFVVADEEATAPEVLEAELRRHLGDHLPSYMVPALFVFLPQMPLTANGKVDRAALARQAAADGEPPPRRGNTAPQTPLEEVVAGLWLEVLDVAPGPGASPGATLSLEDDFFELGGDSLRATRLMVLVRQTLGVDLPLRELFEAPTVAGLAAAVARASGRAPTPSLPLLEPDAQHRFEPFPMTEVQQAYWVGRTGAFDLGNVATHSYLEMETPGLDLDRLQNALRRLIARHDMLRAVMLEDGRQRVLAEVPPFEIQTLDLRHRAAEEVEQALAEVRAELSHQVLDPARWPLFDIRATLLPKDGLRLHLSRDALIYDAWSAFLLERELAAFYQDPTRELEALEVTFRDCVLAERALKESAAYEHALHYWRERIPTLPAAPDLPLAIQPTDLQQPRFERRSAEFDAATWRGVKELASGFGLTPSSVLLAVFGEVLAAFARHPHFCLNLTLFNRLPLHPQVHQVVGDFTALALLEIEVAAEESLRQRARRVQERLWDDLDQRYVGGVRVQRELARERGLRAAAMPVVFTSTLGFPQPEGEAREEAEEAEGGNRLMHSISQTPQVWLDHQVGEVGDVLFFNWDSVADLFPQGFIDTLFEVYCQRLRSLAEKAAWECPAVQASAADLQRFYEGLPAQIAAPAAPRRPEPVLTGRVQPEGALEEQLVNIWREVLELDTVGVEENFFELGGDSVLGIRIVSRAARAGIEIRPTALFEHQTVATLARALSSRAGRADACLVELQRGTSPPVFCVHAAGGNVSGYGRLAQALGAEWSVYGLRALGLLAGEEPRRRVGEMAAAYLEEIRAQQPEGPYRLLGWSSGGHVAFEMALRLEEAGESVEWLVLLDTPSAMPSGEVDEEELLLRLLTAHGVHSRAALEELGFEAQLEMIGELLREAWGLPAEFDVQEARRLLRVYAASLEASRAFRPRPYGGRVVLLRAEEEEAEVVSLGESLGWREWVRGGVEEVRVAGRHETLLSPANLSGIVDGLRGVLGNEA